jgi:hypothetical protein
MERSSYTFHIMRCPPETIVQIGLKFNHVSIFILYGYVK